MGQKETKRRATPERDRDARGERRLHPAESAVPSEAPPAPKGRGVSQELTTANKIMVAASKLDEERETFTAEDLIVVAWKQFPESFGLTGYRDIYPDSNRVLSKLMGSVGLCSRGWLEQVSTKTYKMTASGRKLVAGLRTALANHVTPPAPEGDAAGRSVVRKVERAAAEPAARSTSMREVERPKPEPVAVRREATAATSESPSRAERSLAAVGEAKPRVAPSAPTPVVVPSRPTPVAAPARGPTNAGGFDGSQVLLRLATSVASQKFSRGGLVTFADACQFWAISPGSHPGSLPPRLAEIEQVLKRAEGHIQSTGSSIRVNDRIDVTLTTVIGLSGLHRMLIQKYHRELENIRGRASESNNEEEG